MAWENKSLTLEAPTPTNISTNSDPDIEKNGTPASPATALAIKVFPVPGGPTSNTPDGILAPSAVNLSGNFRNSTTSSSSSFASGRPATSKKVTFAFDPTNILALLFPKFIALFPEPWACLIIKNRKPNIKIKGNNPISIENIVPIPTPFFTTTEYAEGSISEADIISYTLVPGSLVALNTSPFLEYVNLSPLTSMFIG